MDNSIAHFNEHILLNFDIADDKIFKIILALECFLEFDEFKAFDFLNLCKITRVDFDQIESYIDTLVSSSILIKEETTSKFVNLYKLNDFK